MSEQIELTHEQYANLLHTYLELRQHANLLHSYLELRREPDDREKRLGDLLTAIKRSTITGPKGHALCDRGIDCPCVEEWRASARGGLA